MLAAASPNSGLLDINGTLLAEIIVFLVMVLILWRWAYPIVIRTAETREKVIEDGLQHAQEAEKRLADVRVEVEKLLEEARSEAREIADRTHRAAAAEADELRTKARQDSKAFAERAQADIVDERDRALRELRTQFGALVVSAAARVLGEAVDAKAHQKLIDSSLEALEKLPR